MPNTEDTLSGRERAMLNCIGKLDPFKDVKRMDYEKCWTEGLIVEISEEIDRVYYERMVVLCRTESTGDLEVVYTPLHGTGLRTAEKVFPAARIKNIFIVEGQRTPDNLLPTVNSPNPEDPDAMKMAIALAGRVEADITVGTDLDADRMGAAHRIIS